jgi:hypothetical protein
MAYDVRMDGKDEKKITNLCRLNDSYVSRLTLLQVCQFRLPISSDAPVTNGHRQRALRTLKGYTNYS